MPSKSRHTKAKHSHASKKSRAMQRLHTPGVESPSADVPQPVVTSVTNRTQGNTVTPTRPKVAQYPYITSELRRIFIFAGIILVILIILSQVLS